MSISTLNPPVEEKSYMKDFLVLWVGQLFSLLGSGVVSFVITWYITDVTKNVIYLSLMMVFTFIPNIILSPIAGTLADKINRKFLLIATDGFQALFTFILIIILVSDISTNTVWLLIGFNTIRSVFQALQSPAYMSIIPQMVPREKLSNINGLTQLFQSLIQLGAPVLGALLYSQFGLGHSLWIDIITFGFAFILILPVSIPPVVKESSITETTTDTENFTADSTKSTQENNIVTEKEGFWHSLKSGYLAMVAIEGLLPLMLLMSLSNFLLSPFNTLSSYMVNVVHQGNEKNMAWIAVSMQAGMILGSAVMSVKKNWKHKTIAIMVTLTTLWIGTILFGLAPIGNFWWLSLAGFLITFLLPIGATITLTMIQMSVPHAKMGRVFAFFKSFNSIAMLLGFLLVGPLAKWLGAVQLMVYAGILGFVMNMVMYFFSKMRLVEENLNKSDE